MLLIRDSDLEYSPSCVCRKAILSKCSEKMEKPAVTPVHPIPTPLLYLTTLLLGDTDGSATATGGLGVLTTDTEAPVMSETTVSADLLEALEIITELGVDTVGQNVRVLAVNDITLSVQEPAGDLVLGGVLDDGDDSLELFGGELTGAADACQYVSSSPVVLSGPIPLVQIDIGLLANQVGVSATDTLDLGQGVHDLLLSVDIGVQKTENLRTVRIMLEFLVVADPGLATSGPRRPARRWWQRRRRCISGGDHLRTGSSTSLPLRAT